MKVMVMFLYRKKEKSKQIREKERVFDMQIIQFFLEKSKNGRIWREGGSLGIKFLGKDFVIKKSANPTTKQTSSSDVIFIFIFFFFFFCSVCIFPLLLCRLNLLKKLIKSYKAKVDLVRNEERERKKKKRGNCLMTWHPTMSVSYLSRKFEFCRCIAPFQVVSIFQGK